MHSRHEKRYEIVAPATYWWPGPDNSLHTSTGFTRNISSTGLLVNAGVCPPVGVLIQLTIYLPAHEGFDCEIQLHAEGTVVRIENNKTCSGKNLLFASSVLFHTEHPRVGWAADIEGTASRSAGN